MMLFQQKTFITCESTRNHEILKNTHNDTERAMLFGFDPTGDTNERTKLFVSCIIKLCIRPIMPPPDLIM